jgi:hypothetical protein
VSVCPGGRSCSRRHPALPHSRRPALLLLSLTAGVQDTSARLQLRPRLPSPPARAAAAGVRTSARASCSRRRTSACASTSARESCSRRRPHVHLRLHLRPRELQPPASAHPPAPSPPPARAAGTSGSARLHQDEPLL